MSDVMDHPAGQAPSRKRGGTATSLLRPSAILALAVAIAAILLSLPLRVPIGAMYWDLVVYFDAANRIFTGQVPTVDFFAPVGPLGYYLFAAGTKLFPQAQPLLLVHWSLLAVTAPLMVLALMRLDRRSRMTALALLIPFLVFSMLPFNTRSYYPYPGSDGFGIYNRQVCQLLYVLTVGLLFVRAQRMLAVVVVAAMTALFLTKITGFISGLMLCAFAFAAGRIAFMTAVGAAAAFFALFGVMELTTGFVSQYAIDILTLVEMNSGSLAPRFLQAASHTFGIVAPAGILVLVLIWHQRRALRDQLGGLIRRPSFAGIAAVLDRPALWLAAILFAGIFFETQNTGSQALIFVWPALVWMFATSWGELFRKPPVLGLCLLLSAAAALPPIVNTTQEAARTYLGAIKNVPLANDNLRTLGQVNARPEIMARAEKMLGFYPDHRDTYQGFVEIGELPEFIFYSGLDFQLDHLMAVDRAVTDIRRLEERNGIRFETVMNINFVNPFAWLMDRRAPLHLAIGADPSRAVPDPSPEEIAAIEAADLILLPTCPLTTANDALHKLYAPAMKAHRRITLDACFDAFVHPRFGDLSR